MEENVTVSAENRLQSAQPYRDYDFVESRWFAVSVRSGKEKQVSQLISGKGYRVLLPMTTSRKITSTYTRKTSAALFPGYLFCQLNLTETRMPVLTTPDVLGLVGFRNGPVPLRDQEVIALQRIAEAGLKAQPWPYVASGTEVQLLAGPLSGLRGTVVEQRRSSHLLVSVQLLQRTVSVEIQREWAYVAVSREVQ